MPNNITKLFYKNGFCLIKKNFFLEKDVKDIKFEINKTLNNLTNKKSEDKSNIAMGGKSVVIRRITEHSEFIFTKINNLIQNDEIKFFLENVLGSNYKISEIIYRHSEPGDTGLGVHQDADNEHTLVINLDDTNQIDGSTIFLSKSHNFHSTIENIFPNNSLSEKISNKLIFLFNWLKGNSGDIGFFDNKVWHGRACNKKENISSSILVGFYPSGSTVKFSEDHIFFSDEYFKKNKGKELADRQNFNDGAELIDNGKIKLYKINNDQKFSKQNNKKNNYFDLKFLIFLSVSKILYALKKK